MHHSARQSPVMALVPLPFGRFGAYASTLRHGKAFSALSFEIFFLRRVPVTGGPPLPGVLSLYPFGIKDGPSSVPLAMHHPIGFACQVQRYINKGRRSLSDAPSASLVRRLPKNHGGIFPLVSLKSFVGKTSVSVDLSHS